MNRQLNRVSATIGAMFFALFVAVTTVQFFSADSLTNDPRNVRSVYDSYKTQRGAIFVGNQAVAYSTKSDDVYHYLRKYSSPMYSSVTGFFSFFQGATGLEATGNDYLTGKNSAQFFEQINALFSGNSVSGANLRLTIDPKAQAAAWNSLGNLTGAVVAIEPKTGKILALVSKPSFDANWLAGHNGRVSAAHYQHLLNAKSEPLINRAIGGDLYAPGSVFKIVVAAAAFESGKYTPLSRIPNPVRYQLPGTNTFVMNSTEGRCGVGSTVTIADALRLSCNVPFAQLGIALGQDAIRSQAEKFGFGQTLHVPLTVTPSTYPSGMDDAQTGLSAFGQFDDRVSPLQMALISATIANGGVAMQPNLIQSVQSSNFATLSTTTPSQLGTPISAKTASRLTKMMIAAVESGVSYNGKVPGVSTAGKTGTAQNGPGQPYTLWFTGFAPTKNPKVAVAVVVANGGGQGQSGRGNTLAAPIARAVMQAVLNR